MGVVFRSRALDADLTIDQNLAYHAALDGLPQSVARARAAEVTEQVGLADLTGARVARLSGGQQRRAEIARALLHRPRLLLLDEPTVGLDVRSRDEVARGVRVVAERDGVGVLWATHLLDEIDPADQVILLHKGRVLAADSAGRLAAREGLCALPRDDRPRHRGAATSLSDLGWRGRARAFAAIVWREGLRFLRQRERFLSALVRPLVWLFIFTAGFQAVLGLSITPLTRPKCSTTST